MHWTSQSERSDCLTLLPGESADPIRIQLQKVVLDPEHDRISAFEALSYTWGSKDDPETVSIVDGVESNALNVTRKLAVALAHLRYASNKRIMWIDAISVIQEDLRERSKQVLTMVDTYSYAKAVAVWLGPEADSSSNAISYLSMVGGGVYFDRHRWRFSRVDNHLFPEKSSACHDAATTAVHCLLHRPWFERVWIRQEIALAARSLRDIMLVCGHSQMPWDRFCQAVYFFVRIGHLSYNLSCA